ncbi:MAG: beta-ketoacyl-ACP synthase II [Bacteroidales bacterium]|jgi:3-oxoacyl-[acyl-carrier-protein] synthase II|nr:beta-ketoacyl-ACP synthase II [Bacteroidales bacterium]
MQLKRVAVTGIGALTPIGNTVPEYWNGLVNGVSGSDWITRFDASKFKTRFACEVRNFDPAAFFDRKEIKKYDLYTQFAIVAATEAIENSGLDLERTDLEKVGVIWASGIGGIATFAEELKAFYAGDGTPRFNPFFIPKMISDIAAGQISIKYGLKGPNYATVSACASSSNAIIDAFNYIRLGHAEVFVAGGSEAAINESGVGGFNSMQALSTNNDNYQTASRPFDKDRDGFVIGEGAGGLILEEYGHAVKRGARIYAEVVGGGMSADAYHLTASHPEGDGAYRAMKAALSDAGITAESIDYINVHGTSTPVGDPSETTAIVRLFGDHAYRLNISATKSMTGHLLGAAGAVEAIAAILAMNNGIIPPTINHFTDDPAIDGKLNFTFNKAQKREVGYALSNTFGFGGHNTSVIFKKPEL